MTEPRRWPQRAERYRMETLAKAGCILDLAREIKGAIMEERSGVKAIFLLTEIMLAAKEIEEMMREAKRGKEED